MRGPDNRSLILIYIGLALSCAILGIGFTSIVLLFCAQNDIDITRNLWILAIPPLLSLGLNVLFIELYRKIRGK